MGSSHFLAFPFFFFFFILFVLFVSSVLLPALGDDNKTTHGPSVAFDPTRVTQLSWRPRVFLYKGFLSEKECDHLINMARDKLQKSMVADNESGKNVMSEFRTSSGMFFSKAQDEIIADIEARIATWTFLPVENGEPIQVLHYEHGQKYEPHLDYFRDKFNQQFGGHRMGTVLMYLSNVEKGGETVFPITESRLSQPKDESWSECAKLGYAGKVFDGRGEGKLCAHVLCPAALPIELTLGDIMLRLVADESNLRPNATTDTSSLHGSCPVIEGEKWSATKWIHVRNFDKPYKQVYSGKCSEENENCSRWAKIGECVKNPLYMIGNETVRGYCMKSCNVCSS